MKAKAIPLIAALVVVLSVGASAQLLGNKNSDANKVKNALQQADLKGVSVSDDASKNTITLTGTLHSEQAKERAAQVAQSAAPGRTIANEISVQPVGRESQARTVASNLDDGIENDYKAALVSSGLDKQSVHYKAKNGVLVLTGSVKTADQKREAEQLGSKVPNVRQVVNQIDVRR